jgi:hypothetical protein
MVAERDSPSSDLSIFRLTWIRSGERMWLIGSFPQHDLVLLLSIQAGFWKPDLSSKTVSMRRYT